MRKAKAVVCGLAAVAFLFLPQVGAGQDHEGGEVVAKAKAAQEAHTFTFREREEALAKALQEVPSASREGEGVVCLEQTTRSPLEERPCMEVKVK